MVNSKHLIWLTLASTLCTIGHSQIQEEVVEPAEPRSLASLTRTQNNVHCHTCATYDNSRHCVQRGHATSSSETCCLSQDISSSCTHDASNGIYCVDSPASQSTPIYAFFGNCLQTTPDICGGTHELVATDKEKYIFTENVRYYRSANTEACYWHISIKGRNTWSSDSVIRIIPTNITNGQAYLYKGSSIYTANETVNDNNNLTQATVYEIGYKNDAILVFIPTYSTSLLDTKFDFTYKVVGTELSNDSLFD